MKNYEKNQSVFQSNANNVSDKAQQIVAGFAPFVMAAREENVVIDLIYFENTDKGELIRVSFNNKVATINVNEFNVDNVLESAAIILRKLGGF
jgi:hypothetical protein